jgi:hypothetical protein
VKKAMVRLRDYQGTTPFINMAMSRIPKDGEPRVGHSWEGVNVIYHGASQQAENY